MAVDYAKSERTSCSSCGERILQDALRFKVQKKWCCIECFGSSTTTDCSGTETLSSDDQRIVSELRQKRKCPKILQQAEEQRAVRQCLREWQRWPGPGPEAPGSTESTAVCEAEASASEASTEVADSKWLAQALAKIQASLAQTEDLADMAN